MGSISQRQKCEVNYDFLQLWMLHFDKFVLLDLGDY